MQFLNVDTDIGSKYTNTEHKFGGLEALRRDLMITCAYVSLAEPHLLRGRDLVQRNTSSCSRGIFDYVIRSQCVGVSVDFLGRLWHPVFF